MELARPRGETSNFLLDVLFRWNGFLQARGTLIPRDSRIGIEELADECRL